ncbi:hypothetical protein FRX31_012897 [Thalictrum thalictroides]|uniref:Uncharacterized protein n=1 Tax=Thalictrum thalictroides TaxID=46969 RepID=A0A7J6WJG6_THATH|nr:hypothetical protein FRX31_012897 [Thalictrum thalictroides]
MPQVDLETLVCGGGSNNDRKIACESNLSDLPTDFPAESYFVSKEDEFDWFDRNAVYERKGSTKGYTNPNTTNSISTSKRYSLKSKASIIGLPKLQKTTYLDLKFRRNCKPVPANARYFAKRSRSLGKSSVPLTEPSSPKVSCIGRVRSKRDRSRRLRLQLAKEKKLPTASVRSEKAGLWRSFKAVLHLGRRKDNSVDGDREIPMEKQKPLPKIIVTSEKCNLSVNEPPSLGGLKRFVSGRRSDSFGRSDVDLSMNEYDSPDEEVSSVWGRRGVGPGMVISCDREWECVGPASV